MLGSPIILGYTVIHLLSVGVTLGLAGYTVRHYWQKPLGRVFTGLLVAASIWAGGSLVRLFISDLELFIAVTAFKYIGIAVTPVLFVLFALLYDGRSQWVTRPMIVAMSVLPAVSIPIIATTQAHELFYKSYTTTTVDTASVLTIETVGSWYWVVAFFSWGLMLVGSGLLIHAGVKRSKFYRLQLLILLPAIGISWLTNILYVVWSWPHPALDPTPIGFAATSLLLGFGLFSTQLIEVAPSARSLVFDVIGDPVLVVNQADRLIDANSAAQPLLSTSEPIGAELSQVLVADLHEQLQADSNVVEIRDDSTGRHYRYQEQSDADTLDGRILIFTEITELQNSQQETKQAQKQLRQMIDLVPDPLYVKNLDDEVLLSNEANASLHGLTPAELEGTREREIEADVENIDDFDKYRQREIEALKAGKPVTHEEVLEGPDNQKHIFRMTRIPFSTAGDDQDAVLGYARDVTELKEYEQELERAKQELKASNEAIAKTNEELETLNRVLRHDIRNDIVVMSRLGSELEQYVDEEGAELLDQLLERGEHIRSLTTGLRDLMRTVLDETRELRPIRIDTVLESEIRDISQTYEEAVVTIEDIPRSHVQANQMLSSVFRNILENAILHNDSDVPDITVSAQERTDRVEVRISDNGPGVPDSMRDDIFGKGEKGLESTGTGIGLYLVAQLLNEYGGEVWVEDNDPTGAVFVVELEQASAETQHSSEV